MYMPEELAQDLLAEGIHLKQSYDSSTKTHDPFGSGTVCEVITDPVIHRSDPVLDVLQSGVTLNFRDQN